MRAAAFRKIQKAPNPRRIVKRSGAPCGRATSRSTIEPGEQPGTGWTIRPESTEIGKKLERGDVKLVMRHIGISAIVLAGTLAGGASHAQEPAFDSVTVGVADPARRPTPDKRTSGGPGTSDPGPFYFANAGMGELIMRAYGIKLDQLSGPCWILGVKRCADEFVNFEISATMPANMTEERFEAMLRNLLG
jgi:hypothetical protein